MTMTTVLSSSVVEDFQGSKQVLFFRKIIAKIQEEDKLIYKNYYIFFIGE